MYFFHSNIIKAHIETTYFFRLHPLDHLLGTSKFLEEHGLIRALGELELNKKLMDLANRISSHRFI